MSQVVELPDRVYRALQKAAEASGTTLAGWIAAHLAETEEVETTEEPAAGQGTLADLFAGRVGRIRSGGKDRLSEECGAKFAEHLEAKRKAGHL